MSQFLTNIPCANFHSFEYIIVLNGMWRVSDIELDDAIVCLHPDVNNDSYEHYFILLFYILSFTYVVCLKRDCLHEIPEFTSLMLFCNFTFLCQSICVVWCVVLSLYYIYIYIHIYIYVSIYWFIFVLYTCNY